MTPPPQPLLGVNGRLFVSWNEDLVVLAIVVPVLKVLKIVVVGNNNLGRSDQFHPLKSLIVCPFLVGFEIDFCLVAITEGR